MQRISSVFRSRIYLLVSALFCLTTVVANASPELLCTPRWQVPNPCPHESGNCLPILKIDSKGKLYALDLETSVLSIFQPNGQLRGQYNLSLFFSWRSMVSDFLALDGNNVLVSAIDSKLYIYDVASRNLLPVQLKTPAYFEPCTDIFASLILGRLSRLGASG